ncbi:MAG: response regulator [Trichlorobacter sp.]|uniref:response regulator n=1 Tax=Trichlorobacter sp. TaxID=2911007 RepID=UPI00256DFCD9|nr:response regulator [Trichlorobacter sp.]MDK9718933.1 response regulator [Trichlorobacter sp.]
MVDTQPIKILAVDDEKAIQRFLRTILESEGFAVQIVDSAAAAQVEAALFKPDLLLLDLGLPDMDGIDLLRLLREWLTVPIIVLSVREREDDKVLALDAGADDYLTKPFGIAELLARIRVALRRRVQAVEPVFTTGELAVDIATRNVTSSGAEVTLTPTEYELLRLLVLHAGKVVTHNMILSQVWGEAGSSQQQVLRVTISNLRYKIEPNPARPRYLITEPGVGYKLRLVD